MREKLGTVEGKASSSFYACLGYLWVVYSDKQKWIPLRSKHETELVL